MALKERLNLVLPKGTVARAGRAALSLKFETTTAYVRRRVLDAIEADLKEAKREKDRA